MSIRFFCAACGQPIEVDDAWAGKLVACPYCRATVKSPLESAYAEVTASGLAGPVLAQSAVPPPIPGYLNSSTPAARGGGLAIASLVLAILTLGTEVVFLSTLLSDKPRFVADVNRMQSDPAAQQKMSKEWVDTGQVPTWAYGILGLCCATLPLMLASAVTSLIAIFRPRRRGFAVAALALTVVSISGCFLSNLF